MAIFDEPSRQPLPQPTFEDVTHAGRKTLASMIPFVGGAASELLGLLSSPVAQRRDDWFEDLARRLHDLEGTVAGFRFDDLSQNEQFVSATLQATQAALRTHSKEKLEALRNAVLNVAIGNAPSDILQTIFLSIVDSITPTHLQVLQLFVSPNPVLRDSLRQQRDICDQVVNDLNNRGLLKDVRPFVVRNRDASELILEPWKVSSLGRQFLAFIAAPEGNK